VAFPWQNRPSRYRPRTSAIDMYRSELSQRAAMLRRLGYPRARALARLRANVAWDYEVGAGPRPAELDDAAIARLVDQVYT
jgi:hypothetical protein